MFVYVSINLFVILLSFCVCDNFLMNIFTFQYKVYYLGYSRNLRIEVLNFVPSILEMSSVLHVALLVSLRVYAIFRPTSYREMHVKLRYISIIVIWLSAMLVHTATRIALFLEKETIFYYGNVLILLFCNTLPVVLILIMYIMLMWILRDRTSKLPDTNVVELHSIVNGHPLNNESSISPGTEQTERKMTLAIQRIVLFVILCYGPFLIWRAYYYNVVDRRQMAMLRTGR